MGGNKKTKKKAFFCFLILAFFIKILFYLFLERGEEKEKESERNINVWLPLEHHPLGTRPATQVYAPTGDPTGDLLVLRPALNTLNYTNWGTGAERIFLNTPMITPGLFVFLIIFKPLTYKLFDKADNNFLFNFTLCIITSVTSGPLTCEIMILRHLSLT